MDLDEYINLKGRVEGRMKAVNLTSTGDDNILTPNEELELEYRKKQLRKLQEEVVDLEDMDTGINIMDLGLNEFRLDLLNYLKKHPEIEDAPKGMNAIVRATNDLEPGVIFVLKNLKSSVNIEGKNRLHPFYMVYVTEEGEIKINHLHAKKTLDTYRLLCREREKPDEKLCRKFNTETKNGKKMSEYSDLLEEAIISIIDVKDDDEVDRFISGEEVSFLSEKIEGLDDFELVSFLVIKGEDYA